MYSMHTVQSSCTCTVCILYDHHVHVKSLNAKHAIPILVKRFLALCYEMEVVWHLARFAKNVAISNAVFSGRERVLTEKIGSIEFG